MHFFYKKEKKDNTAERQSLTVIRPQQLIGEFVNAEVSERALIYNLILFIIITHGICHGMSIKLLRNETYIILYIYICISVLQILQHI